MLLKLMPEQVSEYWDGIKFAVEEALPPVVGETPEKMNNILMALLNGEMDCWVSYRKEESGVVGFVITTITHDSCSDTTNLLLYVIYGMDQTKGVDWIEGYQALRKFALSKGCHRIIGYTTSDKVIKIAKKFGNDSVFSFISIPL